MELYDRPNSRFVGEFIGSPQMNIFSGTLDRSGGTPVLRSGEVSLPLGEVEARDGAKLDVGIRPEHLDRAPDGQGMVRPVVDVIEPLGSDTMAICRLGEQEVTARLDPRAPLSAGQQIALSYDPANLHYFDGESGGRLSVRVLEAA